MSKPHLCSLAQPATSKFASVVEFRKRSIILYALDELAIDRYNQAKAQMANLSGQTKNPQEDKK